MKNDDSKSKENSEVLRPYSVKTNRMSQTQELHDLWHEMTGWVSTQSWECQVDP